MYLNISLNKIFSINKKINYVASKINIKNIIKCKNMNMSDFSHKKNLDDKINIKYAYAIEKGAISKIKTKIQKLKDENTGINFLINVAESLNEKSKIKKNEGNPFLNIEPELYISDIGENHKLIFNKFNVVDYHLLIVTNEFEVQENALNYNDFSAIMEVTQCNCRNFLFFYNCGPESGASQPHKHIQLIPIPLCPHDNQQSDSNNVVPIEKLIYDHLDGKFKFPFFVLIEKIDCFNVDNLTNTYLRLLNETKSHMDKNQINWNSYNLLLTNDWMLLVPRRHEKTGPFSFNSLAFAGTFFIKSEAVMTILKEKGPLNLLKEVTFEINY